MDQGMLIHEVYRSHNDAPQSVGILWTNDQPVAETSTLQHTTDTHVPGGTRTHNPSKGAAAYLHIIFVINHTMDNFSLFHCQRVGLVFSSRDQRRK